MSMYEYQITTTTNISDIGKALPIDRNLYPSERSLINAVRLRTHITAIGSDTVSKRELSSDVMSSRYDCHR